MQIHFSLSPSFDANIGRVHTRKNYADRIALLTNNKMAASSDIPHVQAKFFTKQPK